MNEARRLSIAAAGLAAAIAIFGATAPAQSLPGRLPGTLPGQQPASSPSAAGAIPPACCDITEIDKASAVVRARERSSGRILEFRVGNPSLLQTLKVGQDVHANFEAKRISVDGKTMCCSIAKVAAAPQAAAPPKTAAADPKAMGAPKGLPGQRPAQSPGQSPGQPPPQRSAAADPAKASGPARAQDPPDDDANEDDEPDPPAMARKKAKSAGAGGGSRGQTVRLDKYPDAQGFLKKVADAMARKEMDVSLIGGEKYMINRCMGIKVRAGNFKMKLASPNARLDGSEAKLTFRVEHISLNGISLRMRPSTNVLKPCHFGKKFSVGGSAKDIKVAFSFDPVMDLKQCKFTTLGSIKTRVDIGNLNLKPLQNDLDRIAKNAFEDAVNNFFNGDDPFKIIDDVFEADCPGKRA